MKSYVVLGAGRFGSSVAKSLYESGNDVLAIDEREDVIEEISGQVTHAILGNCSDEKVLKSLGVRNFDVAIVAIGEDIQASILVTLLLREMGVKYIVAKAQNDLHAKVLNKVGADRVVFPERDMGIRVAQSLSFTNIVEYLELTADYSIAEIETPATWAGKTIKEVDVRSKHFVNIVAVKKGEDINATPSGDVVLAGDEILVIIGSNKEINKLK